MASSPSKLALALLLVAPAAAADPIRLRGDALGAVETPAGLFSLEAHDRATSWMSAEASVWFGGDADDAEGDALVIAVDLRDPKRRGSVKIGRHVITAGALRPMHVDGVSSRVHLPRDFDVELFGGLPVVPALGPRPWDWLVGGRASRAFGDARVGVAWMERRDHGELHTHEVAADGAVPIGARVDVAAGAAVDVISFGLAEARLSAVARRSIGRVEVFAIHREASHLLPATSLFSVIGDSPATRAGASAKWNAAPRLDVTGTAALRVTGDQVREDLVAGARLRLDDRGASSLGIELRRQGAVDGGWTGVRGTGRLALTPRWSTSAEVELVMPDEPGDRGTLWPWALGAVTWRPTHAWELAGAVEASATPQARSRVDALVRISRTWEGP